jgi:putative transposase
MEDRSFEKAPLYPVAGRKSPAQGVHFNPDGPTLLWVTVCAKDRREWIARKQVQTALHKIWLEQALAWLVGDYLLMPDHLHFFCAPCDPAFSVEKWIAFWKSQFTKGHQEDSWEWQKKAFHHRIRSLNEFHEKWIYMMENPFRKKLVENIEDWPWKGQVHPIRW